MSWDHTLLRKFSNTGHFRLLNQVRSELKANPLKRSHDLRSQAQQIKTTQTQQVKASQAQQIKTTQTFNNTSTNTQKIKYNLESQSNLVAEQKIASLDEQQNIGTQSFRDRLNAIDMR